MSLVKKRRVNKYILVQSMSETRTHFISSYIMRLEFLLPPFCFYFIFLSHLSEKPKCTFLFLGTHCYFIVTVLYIYITNICTVVVLKTWLN